jgi:hypothetical protein
MFYYAGIGSRRVPYAIQSKMKAFGQRFALMGYTLRSGAAEGSDRAFEDGCKSVKGDCEIWLPWKGFNNSDSPLIGGQTLEALQSVAKYHPNPSALSPAAKKLMARNFNQLYGHNSIASRLCVCYTPNGELVGGTSQALRIILGEIPDCVIINLGFPRANSIHEEYFREPLHCEVCEKKYIVLAKDMIGCLNCDTTHDCLPETKRLLDEDVYAREYYSS